MKNKIILLLILLLNITTGIFAQQIKKDTIYYLLDTLKTPPFDRMISVENANTYKFYTINCPCLSSGNKPVFRSNINNSVFINSNALTNIKFISLVKLIELAKRNDDEHLKDKFTIYFIEPFRKEYIKSQVFFEGGNVVTTE